MSFLKGSKVPREKSCENTGFWIVYFPESRAMIIDKVVSRVGATQFSTGWDSALYVGNVAASAWMR